jgi:HPt (histidine-containing phosphotransfer) domain-containing protein
LQAVSDQAAIDDDAALRRQASEATTQLHAWLAGSDSAAERMVVALADPLPATQPPAHRGAAAPMPVDAAAIDAELLEIFLSEAEEVLGNIAADVQGGLDALRDADVLIRVRRGFHTLKGSSRMVGLNRYGEAAWAVEQVMNLWIAEAREPQPELLALLQQAHDLLREWALALQHDPSTLREIARWSPPRSACAIRLGAGPRSRWTRCWPTARRWTPCSMLLRAGRIAAGSAPRPSAGPRTGRVLPFRLSGGLASDDDNYKVIGPVRIGLPLYNVYLQEADDLLRQFATDLSEWKHENHPCPSELALRVAHAAGQRVDGGPGAGARDRRGAGAASAVAGPPSGGDASGRFPLAGAGRRTAARDAAPVRRRHLARCRCRGRPRPERFRRARAGAPARRCRRPMCPGQEGSVACSVSRSLLKIPMMPICGRRSGDEPAAGQADADHIAAAGLGANADVSRSGRRRDAGA